MNNWLTCCHIWRGRYLLFFLFLSGTFSSPAQTTTLTIRINKEDIYRGKADFTGFDFEIIGAMNASTAALVDQALSRNPEIRNVNLKEASSGTFVGQLKANKGVGPIRMIHMLMNAGITHIDFDGQRQTLKEMRKQIRMRQAKKS